MAKKDPISLCIGDLEKKSGGTLLLMEHLEDVPSPSTEWLLSRKHMLLSRPVAKLAFQVSSKLSFKFFLKLLGREGWQKILGLMTD